MALLWKRAGPTGLTGASGATGAAGAAGMVAAAAVADTTLSITTTASQQIVVTAKGSIVPGLSSRTISLNYDGVVKDSVVVSLLAISVECPFVLRFVLTPGAVTKDVTVTTTGGTLNGVTIDAIKIG